MQAKHSILYLFPALLGGLCVGITHRINILSPLQVVGFALLFWSLDISRKNRWETFMIGFVGGTTYGVLRVYGVGLPAPVIYILLSVAAAYILFLCIGYRLFCKEKRLVGTFALGAWFGLIDWLQVTAIPLFGTAQSFTLNWSSWPRLIQFVNITGFMGIACFIGLLSILCYQIITAKEKNTKRKFVISMAIILTIFISISTLQWFRPLPYKIKIAAFGHAGSVLPNQNTPLLQQYIIPAIRDAGKQGAKIIVLPEMTFSIITTQQRDRIFSKLKEEAKNNKIGIIVGYFHGDENGNFAAVIDTNGRLAGIYQKTHLVPGMEKYEKGIGEAIDVEINGMPISTMICQDDNFTDVSRNVAKKKIAIVGVPTLDWISVANEHFQNSVYRAIESNYAISRAAYGGYSAIISPRGEVIDKVDHFVTNPGMAIATVSYGKGGSLYGLWGNGFMLSLNLLAILVFFIQKRMQLD